MMVFALSDRQPLLDEQRVSEDANLMRAAASGKRDAWNKIVAANLPVVHRAAYQIVRDVQAAEDIAQESFLRLWKMADSWQPKGKIATWLCHVARNLAIDAIRKRGRDQVSLGDEDVVDTTTSPLGALMEKEQEADVDKALRDLPVRQRDAIMLVHFGECNGPVAAKVMGISIEALESLLSRARRTLRTVLSGKGKD